MNNQKQFNIFELANIFNICKKHQVAFDQDLLDLDSWDISKSVWMQPSFNEAFHCNTCRASITGSDIPFLKSITDEVSSLMNCPIEFSFGKVSDTGESWCRFNIWRK